MTVTVSDKYQVVIPKDVRAVLSLAKGMRVSILAKNGIAYIVPVKPLTRLRGLCKGQLAAKGLRDKKDREL